MRSMTQHHRVPTACPHCLAPRMSANHTRDTGDALSLSDAVAYGYGPELWFRRNGRMLEEKLDAILAELLETEVTK